MSHGNLPRRVLPKPPPIDLNAIPVSQSSTPNRIQLWSALRVAPEAVSPVTPAPVDGYDSSIGLSPAVGIGTSGWADLPSHILELIFASLRDPQGRWPSRKVLFGVCGVCKLWRRVGHTLFFSNVWQNHSDTVVHPSQLFSLCPHPLRLHGSDHLLRCFVLRTPCNSGGMSPRLGRLWRFAMYLGSDHRGGRATPGGLGGGQSARPQLLMWARQTSRRCYQLLLSPALGPGPGPGGFGSGSGSGCSSRGWLSPPRGGGGGRQAESGVVALLRSNLRCSHYELVSESSCPWARRLVALAGYMPPLGGPPLPLISLEYRLRVRGIMLPRRMKVQVPVPHSLQRVVQNPLYDMHEPVAELASPTAAGGWPPLHGAAAGGGGGGLAPAVMAPPLPGAGGAAGGGALPDAVGAAGLFGDGVEGLMDNLEDILEAAMRTEPLLFANMVDAAAVRPDDDEEPAAAAAAAAGAAPDAPDRAGGAGGGAGAGAGPLRTVTSGLGGFLLRSLQSNRRQGFGGGGSVAVGGGAAVHQHQQQAGAGGGGLVQWWGPGSPGRSGAADGAGGAAASGDSGSGDGAAPASASGGAGGWSALSPRPMPLVRLQNKAPHWNDGLMCWCLNFRGRVKMASVKNFQLMCSADAAGRCVMQFGKVEEGVYILDFNPCVLTAAQAFAAALSTFETKYLL